MAQFHFVEDYEKLVARLVAKYPIDEAMSYAVGGNYEMFGQIEAALLKKVGLEDGMHLVDLGCGPFHWHVFENTLQGTKANSNDHLNMFIERNAIAVWAASLGLQVELYLSAGAPASEGRALGQSTAVLRKPV